MMEYKKVHLPEDVLPHNTIIEWWYFNGHLKDSAGNKYAFMDCLFRADIKRVNIPFLKQPFKNINNIPYAYFAHSFVSDIGAQKSYKDMQAISLMSRDSFKRPRLYANYINSINLNGFCTNEIAEQEKGLFHIKTEVMDLYLKSDAGPVLQGKDGLISVCGRESYYYSLPDLKASGIIKIGDKWVKVSGKAWMDQQWADVPYRKDKWSWFSTQLNDSTDIMCVEYDDGHKKDYIMTVADHKRPVQRYKHFSLIPGKDAWISKDTKAKYPTSWIIDLPEKKIRLEINSTMTDQEMIFGEINYWESPTSINATIGKRKIKGVGFMELVGYPSDYNALIWAGKELNSEIQKEAAILFKKIF
jgi:predicted secreted hydrolase